MCVLSLRRGHGASRHIWNDIVPKRHAYTYELFAQASFAVGNPGHPTMPPTGTDRRTHASGYRQPCRCRCARKAVPDVSPGARRAECTTVHVVWPGLCKPRRECLGLFPGSKHVGKGTQSATLGRGVGEPGRRQGIFVFICFLYRLVLTVCMFVKYAIFK